ncbi:amidase [Roseovarius spongiae]|uniref:Amidase n=1 Tax=Roseovarius spongiae TaxID=2320272 RepID=A0A3A8AZ27_9RHOB|nr:amidase [Roseovarius spongiae]RKF16809.1 amidase [Roseovarius spongiae]
MSIPTTAAAIARAVARGEVSATEAVEAALARAEEIAPLNAFTVIDRDGALDAARRIDAGEGGGERPLLGVPFAAKDFTPTKGHPTTRGSWSTGDAATDFDPAYVRRLKAAGAVLIGKTTTPEFAYSGFTHSPRWGVTRNPYDADRTPGGSSGGAAVAVATGCVPIAEGTDMGGSVRIPAALCGLVGLKPSLGRIPMDILPLGSDVISHFGPLATSVEEAALFLSVTQGPDDADILSQPDPGPVYPVAPAERPRLALSVDLGYYHVDPGVRERIEAAAEALRDAGATVDVVNPGWSRALNDDWLALWGVVLAAAWGDALDGYRDRMDPEVVALMEAGRKVSGVEVRRLEATRHRLWADLAKLFGRYDALLTPTCPVTAQRVDADDSDYDAPDAEGRYRGIDMTSPFNLVGECPALSVPVGLADGLPVGMQVVGPRFSDAEVLRIGRLIEQSVPATPPPDWRARMQSATVTRSF